MAFFKGMSYGLIFIVSFGPAFFTLFQTALKYGFKRAMLVSLGINSSDALIAFSILFGMKSVFENPTFKFWLGLVGAVVLLVYGGYSLMRKGDIPDSKSVEGKNFISFYIKGFVLNGLNPLIILSWFGVISLTSASGFSLNEKFWFFFGIFSSVLILDAFKAALTHKISEYINERFLTITNRVLGFVFVSMGIALIVYSFK